MPCGVQRMLLGRLSYLLERLGTWRFVLGWNKARLEPVQQPAQERFSDRNYYGRGEQVFGLSPAEMGAVPETIEEIRSSNLLPSNVLDPRPGLLFRLLVVAGIELRRGDGQ